MAEQANVGREDAHAQGGASQGAPNTKRFSVLQIVLLGLLVVIVGLFVIIALQPGEFHIARSTKISAPPSAVFAEVNDFHNWEAWSPWGKLDPAMKTTYSGPDSGAGAVYAWNGNYEVGEGRMTILESKPDEHIKIQLDFFKPFAGTSIATFDFKPEGDQTVVTWSMEGKNHFVAKAIHLVMDMDKMIGDNFDQGLADMKAKVEGTAKP
jgi:hypothetical protein